MIVRGESHGLAPPETPMTSRSFAPRTSLRARGIAAVTLALATSPQDAQAQGSIRADLLIRGGSVIDGTGAPARRADVAITGDRITFVGDARRERIEATRTIDASGLIVTPGLVDLHCHGGQGFDPELNERPLPEFLTILLCHGVTDVLLTLGAEPLPTMRRAAALVTT